MAGYAARNHPSEGAEHDLWAKALAHSGPRRARRRAGHARPLRHRPRTVEPDPRRARGQARPGARPGGPVLLAHALRAGRRHEPDHHVSARRGPASPDRRLHPVPQNHGCRPGRQGNRAARGRHARLGDRPVRLRGQPAEQQGKRRPRAAGQARPGRARRSRRARAPRSLARRQGSAAIVFGYACHCTVLDYYKFCGDYAGFAAIDLERDIPGCQAMFVAGCGGDQNPIPRRELKLAEGYGRQLAAAVGRVVKGPMRPIQGPLRTGLPGDRPGVRRLAHPRADRGRREVGQLLRRQPGQASARQARRQGQARPPTIPTRCRPGGWTT